MFLDALVFVGKSAVAGVGLGLMLSGAASLVFDVPEVLPAALVVVGLLGGVADGLRAVRNECG